jgi:hypothetical protein
VIPVTHGYPGGRAQARPPKQSPKTSQGWLFKLSVILTVLAVLAPVVYYGGPPVYRKFLVAPIEMPINPTFAHDGRKVMLNVPMFGMTEGTDVSFEYGAERAKSMNDGHLPFKSISTPVDIKETQGKLKNDHVAVTLEYDPSLIPEGLTADQVGMAVFDTTLDTWVPILNAKADPATNTVTALAPHFSWFTAFVLDPLDKVVKVAGQAVETAINASISVQSWFNGLVNEVAGNLMKDLFGQVDPLECNPASDRVKSTATSWFDSLKTCTKPAGDNDKVHISNGFAFPLLTDKLTAGVRLEANDIGNNGEDLAAMIRSAYWASQGRAYIPGASHVSLTVPPEMQKSTMTMELDDEAIAFDLGLAVFSVLSPPSNAAKAAVKTGVAAAVKGQDVATLIGDGTEWFKTVHSMLDCIVSTSSNSIEADLGMEPVDEMFTDEGFKDAAELAHDCLGSTLDAIDLKGALAEMLSSIKVIPAALGSIVYATGGALLDSLPSQFDGIKQKQPTVALVRYNGDSADDSQEQPPAPEEEPQPPAKQEPSRKDVASLAGKWRHRNGTLTINKNGSGTYTVNGFCQPDDPGLSDFQACYIKVGVRFEDAGSGSIYGYWKKPTATSARDGQNNKPVKLAPRDEAAYVDKRFEVTRSTNEHVVAVAGESGERFGGGEFWLCDEYAHNITVRGRQTGGLYLERCNKPF